MSLSTTVYNPTVYGPLTVPPPPPSQVTALSVLGSELYLGTAWGCVVVAAAATMLPITVFRPHEEEVRAIVPLLPPPPPPPTPASAAAGSAGSESDSEQEPVGLVTLGQRLPVAGGEVLLSG